MTGVTPLVGPGLHAWNESKAAGVSPRRDARERDVDPQLVVTLAARAICHSAHAIHGGLTVIPALAHPRPSLPPTTCRFAGLAAA